MGPHPHPKAQSRAAAVGGRSSRAEGRFSGRWTRAPRLTARRTRRSDLKQTAGYPQTGTRWAHNPQADMFHAGTILTRVKTTRKRGGYGRWVRPSPREIHSRHRIRPGRLQLEVRARPLPEQLRRQHLRKPPDVGVVAVDGVVVVLARDRDAVLRALELVLERAEVLVGLELRVTLGDREQPPERRGERGVGLRHLLQIAP